MAFISDGTFPFGMLDLQLVGIPADVIRWKLVLRVGSLPVAYFKKKDGSFERWQLAFSDETKRALKPEYCTGKNVLRVVFKP